MMFSVIYNWIDKKSDIPFRCGYYNTTNINIEIILSQIKRMNEIKTLRVARLHDILCYTITGIRLKIFAIWFISIQR